MTLRSGRDILLLLRGLSIIRTIGRIGLIPNIVESANTLLANIIMRRKKGPEPVKAIVNIPDNHIPGTPRPIAITHVDDDRWFSYSYFNVNMYPNKFENLVRSCSTRFAIFHYYSRNIFIQTQIDRKRFIKQLKEDRMTAIAAVLAFSAINNNDKVGVIFFSDKVEKFIPPKKGRSHILRIIRELIDFRPESQKTDLAEALRYLTNALKKRCTAFIISDFLDTGFDEALRIAGNKHDVVALKIYDESETRLPNIGLVKVFNKETGKHSWVDTSSARARSNYNEWWRMHEKYLDELFKRSGIDNVSISTNQDYVKPLVGLFKVREARM